MASSELRESNFKRIFFINWFLIPLLFLIFSWPYYYFSLLFHLQGYFPVAGSILFAFPFVLTILHGHVTMALGVPHRYLFYNWLDDHPLTYGLFFHDIFISTRFRLLLLASSFLIFGLNILMVWQFNLNG